MNKRDDFLSKIQTAQSEFYNNQAKKNIFKSKCSRRC